MRVAAGSPQELELGRVAPLNSSTVNINIYIFGEGEDGQNEMISSLTNRKRNSVVTC